jgi:energy-coupling factor transporter transmembrane protein EcfT
MKRTFHPLTWWSGAIAISIAVSLAHNTTFNLLVVGGMCFIVYRVNRDSIDQSPWSGGLWFALKIAAIIIVIRAIIGVAIGVPIPGNTLFELPILDLPHWMAGIRIGGAVTQERLSFALAEGIQIATLICIFAAATSLTSPHRLLRQMPIFIYEFGVALVIATSVLPQLVTSAARIKSAQKMRGIQRRGWAGVALPLLEESLARSLDLAATMDSRGYGYSRNRSRYRREIMLPHDLIVIFSALALIPFSWVVLA